MKNFLEDFNEKLEREGIVIPKVEKEMYLKITMIMKLG
jgi:hypothetical protein